jgi:hypothetical protein
MIALAVFALHIGHPGNLSRGKVVSHGTDVVPTTEVGSSEKKQRPGFGQRFGFGKKKRNSETT